MKSTPPSFRRAPNHFGGRNLLSRSQFGRSQLSRWQFSRPQRRLAIEPLEPRIVFSHDGTDAVVWAMPADLEQLVSQDMAAEASSATIYPGAQTTFDTLANGMPILNSFPSAPAAIYLDFDGGTYHSSETLGPYDTDGNPAVFGSDEQQAIFEAWRQISAYFSMFNVNVTTIDTSKPKAWILPSDSGSGGVSYVNVFPDNNSGPQSKTGAATVTSRVSAIAHELGHNFGTWHTSLYDSLGVKTAEYHDSFDALHGPIMGLDYSGVIHKWTWWHDSTSDGGYTLQDDMKLISSDLDNYGGDGYRPDDYGGTIATATPLQSFGVSQSSTGIIERLTDVDAFSFTSTGGRYAIVAGRDAPSGVDLKLSIYNSAGQLIASEDGDPRTAPLTMVNDQHLTLDLPAGTYYAMVESHGNYGDQGQYIVRVDPVSSGWSADDVGLVGVPGYSSYDAASGTYTVTGSGSDIWSTADGFQFLYQTLNGDGQITARITSQENTNSSAKAGVMIRESLADNSKNVMVAMKPGGSTFMQYRSGAGGSSTSVSGPSGSSWQWVRLTRTGNSIKAEVSTNGSSWTTVSTQTVSMGAQVYIGLATTAHNNLKVNTATYTNVAVSGNLNAGPALNDLPASAAVSVTSITSNSVAISWSGVAVEGDVNGDGVVNSLDLSVVKSNLGSVSAAGTPADVNDDGTIDLLDYNLVKSNMHSSSTGYTVERSSDGVNFTQIGGTSGGVTAYTVTGLLPDQRYYFRVRTLGSDGTVSVPSSVANALTNAGAATGLTTSSISTSKVVIDWLDTSGEGSYRVQRSDDGVNNWTTRANLAKNTPSYTDSGSTGITYFYRVQTLDSGSNVVATSSVVSESTRLATVTGLAFTNQASNQLALKWNSVANATGYRVERSLDNSTFTAIASNVTTLSYADNSVSSGNTYYYQVVALKSGITESGAASSVISATPPAAASEVASASASTATASASAAANVSAAIAASAANSSHTKSIVRASVHRFEKETHTTEISKHQRAAIEHVLASWDFDRRDRQLSRAVLNAITDAKPATAGISLHGKMI